MSQRMAADDGSMIMPEGSSPPCASPSAPLVPPCKTRRSFGSGVFVDDGIILVAMPMSALHPTADIGAGSPALLIMTQSGHYNDGVEFGDTDVDDSAATPEVPRKKAAIPKDRRRWNAGTGP